VDAFMGVLQADETRAAEALGGSIRAVGKPGHAFVAPVLVAGAVKPEVADGAEAVMTGRLSAATVAQVDAMIESGPVSFMEGVLYGELAS